MGIEEKTLEAFDADLKAKKDAPELKLLTADDLAALPSIRWLIKGVIPSTGIGAIYGPSGSGKSFLALDMLSTIALGRDKWYGHRITPSRVIYLCLEGGAGLTNRLAAYQQHHEGADFGLVRFHVADFQMIEPANRDDLLKAIRPEGAGLIVIDTMNRATLGLDENAPADMGEIIKASTDLQARSGGMVLLVHHTGKDASKGMRGHSSLHAALDVAIEVTRGADGSHSWKLAKAKDASDGIEHPFRLEMVNLGADEDGDPITSCVALPDSWNAPRMARRTPKQEAALKTLQDACISKGREIEGGIIAVHVDDWRDFYYPTCTADTTEGKKKAFQRIRTDLVNFGAARVRDDYYSPADTGRAAAVSLMASMNQEAYERASNG